MSTVNRILLPMLSTSVKHDTKFLRFCVSTDIWKSYAARIMAISILPFIIVQLSQVLNSKSGAKSWFWLRSLSLSHCFFLTALIRCFILGSSGGELRMQSTHMLYRESTTFKNALWKS